MVDELTRRALLGAIVGGGVASGTFSPVDGYLRRFAPFSGRAFERAEQQYPASVDSPYGTATVSFDEYGVPNVDASSESALCYAVGFVQAADRLFQMDLQRRQMRGQLSEVVGDVTLDSDRFHVKMDFLGAADATWEFQRDSRVGELTTAFADGVNEYIENEALPVEFGLLEYEPEPWTPVDTMLMEKQIAWQLNGRFRSLNRAVAADKLGEDAAEDLYPSHLDHDSPVLRNDGNTAESRSQSPTAQRIDPELVDWLSQFEAQPNAGSNSWVISGDHTESGSPILANDPHLTLMAPPVWYEMNLEGGEIDARGVAFPGAPFVVIGANDSGAWGFTNTDADVMDFYTYETDVGQYKYDGEWREFTTTSREVAVADGQNQQVAVQKTVHGPYLERQGQHVAVAWTGLTASETTKAIYQLNKSDGIADARSAIRKMDIPVQNLVYADVDGNTMHYVTGRIPRRIVDGAEVPGDRVFDGSTATMEWDGFTPYGPSSWDGFVPFEEKPHAINPDYVGTANQRITDDPGFYFGDPYTDPYRGIRVYQLLDERAQSEQPFTPEYARQMQRDTLDLRAKNIVPTLVEVASGVDELEPYVTALEEWDYHMDRDSTGALVFDVWFEAYRRLLFEEPLEEAGLSDTRRPFDWTVINLEPDSRWFDEVSREEAMIQALRTVAEEYSPSDTFGDVNTTASITHPFDQAFLNYDVLPVDGSSDTVNNYHRRSAHGSSWRMVVPMDGTGRCVLPGGNSGNYYSEHYDDQLSMWADDEYREMYHDLRGSKTITFEGGNDV